MDASASDKEIPTSAVFKAPQSLAPSPHMPHTGLDGKAYICYINRVFSSGLILAYIWVFESITSARCFFYGFNSASDIILENALPVIARTNWS